MEINNIVSTPAVDRVKFANSLSDSFMPQQKEANNTLMTERCKDIAASGFTVYTCLAQVSHARKNPDQDERNMFVLSADCI